MANKIWPGAIKKVICRSPNHNNGPRWEIFFILPGDQPANPSSQAVIPSPAYKTRLLTRSSIKDVGEMAVVRATVEKTYGLMAPIAWFRNLVSQAESVGRAHDAC